jgi:hypothetical protein
MGLGLVFPRQRYSVITGQTASRFGTIFGVYVALVFFGCLALAAQPRLRPPDDVGCDRNELTVYAGEVTRYTRAKGAMQLTIRTDEDTVEKVRLPEARMRWRGGPFLPEHWKELEKGKRRVHAWVCKSGTGLIDWQ